MEDKVVEENCESASEESGEKHTIFEISGAVSDKSKGKTVNPFKIDETKCSFFKKLLQLTKYVNRLNKHIRNKREIVENLTSNRINRAEWMYINYMQGKHYLSNEQQFIGQQRPNQLKNTAAWNY